MPPKKKQSASAAAADDPADNGSQYGSAESDNSQSDSEEQATPGTLEELNLATKYMERWTHNLKHSSYSQAITQLDASLSELARRSFPEAFTPGFYLMYLLSIPEKLRPVNFDRCTSHKEPRLWKDLLEHLQSLFEPDILRNRVKAIVPHFRRQEAITSFANRMTATLDAAGLTDPPPYRPRSSLSCS